MPEEAAPSPQPFAHANASKVTERLWIGGDLDADEDLSGRQLRELVEHGLTHVVDTREEWNDADVVARDAPEVSYFWDGIEDAGQRVPPEWFDAGVGFALDALADDGTIVLTHCHAGINRGPSLGLAVLLAQGWDPVDALERIRAARPFVMAAYADDALRWAHDRYAMVHDLDTDLARVEQWRRDHAVTLENVLRLHREIRGEP